MIIAGMSAPQPDPQSDSRDQPVEETLPPSPLHAGRRDRSSSPEGLRPPLPPRPNTLSLLNDETASRATLQAEATTAVSRAEIDTQPSDSVSTSAYSPLAARGLSQGPKAKASLSQLASARASEVGDSASIRSSIHNGDAGDVEAILQDFVASAPGSHTDAASLLHFPEFSADDVDDNEFLSEFDPVGELDEHAGNEGLTQSIRRACIFADSLLIDARPDSTAVEGEAKTLFNSLRCRQADMDSPWRWRAHIDVRWSRSNHHLVL